MELWHFIQKKLSQNQAVYLMCVMQHQGSSPGRQGFKMAVAKDGDIKGSIGGGVMEYNLVEHCKSLLDSGDIASFAKHQIHKGTINNGSGMICSGAQTVLFFPLNKEHLKCINQLIEGVFNGESGLLSITPSAFNFERDSKLPHTYKYTFTNDQDWHYQESINALDTVTIVGGGHVGLACSKLLVQLGYYVIVYDNREDLNTFEENSYANEKFVVNYKTIGALIKRHNSILLIMTNKYTDDKLVLSQCIRKPHQFLGVLGSMAKLDVMFDVLGKEGFSKEELDKVHAPIGLPIGSQTPDEIAVSIAAQLIALKKRK